MRCMGHRQYGALILSQSYSVWNNIQTGRITFSKLVLHNLLTPAPSQHNSISILFERIVKDNFTKQDPVTFGLHLRLLLPIFSFLTEPCSFQNPSRSTEESHLSICIGPATSVYNRSPFGIWGRNIFSVWDHPTHYIG